MRHIAPALSRASMDYSKAHHRMKMLILAYLVWTPKYERQSVWSSRTFAFLFGGSTQGLSILKITLVP